MTRAWTDHSKIMQTVIREACGDDAGDAKACVVAAFEHYTARIGKQPSPMLLDFASEIEARHVWLADSDGVITGVIVQYETALGFYVEAVAVLPQRQGSGIGRTLLQFAEQEATRRGYASVYLATNVKMTENQVLYQRIGYVEYARKFEGGYGKVFYRKPLAGS